MMMRVEDCAVIAGGSPFGCGDVQGQRWDADGAGARTRRNEGPRCEPVSQVVLPVEEVGGTSGARLEGCGFGREAVRPPLLDQLPAGLASGDHEVPHLARILDAGR